MAFWRLTVKYSIHDTYGESDIFLNIARNSGFKLNDCYFHNYNSNSYIPFKYFKNCFESFIGLSFAFIFPPISQ